MYIKFQNRERDKTKLSCSESLGGRIIKKSKKIIITKHRSALISRRKGEDCDCGRVCGNGDRGANSVCIMQMRTSHGA